MRPDAVCSFFGAAWNYAIRNNAEYFNLIFKLPNLLEDIDELEMEENEEFLEAWMR